MWNLWFPSAGVFAEVLAGRATGTQITFPPMNRHNRSVGPQWVAAMPQITTQTPINNHNGPHQCNEACGDGKIKLACGCMMPAETRNNQTVENQNDPAMWGQSITQTVVLRDTGSTPAW